ncbi:MAG: 50S ribosomal protein L11 methyltransferase [Pseudomonadales bacterium]
MAWLRVSVAVDGADGDRVSDLLQALGALSVTADAAGADELLEPAPGTTPLWRTVRLQALFDVERPLGDITEALRAAGHALADVDFVDDADWMDSWRAHAVRRAFAGRLWLLPRDEPLPEAAQGGVVLRLDPGLAFGSGSHETTRLCLEWLAAVDLAGARLLDFGCGSGILAVAACLLGAARVVAVDHDPQALVATRDNAAYNSIEASRLEVLTAAELPEPATPFDVVIANILANPLIELAPRLTALVRPGGRLVLSGLLATQADAIRASYPQIRFEPVVQDGDWIRMDGVRVA